MFVVLVSVRGNLDLQSKGWVVGMKKGHRWCVHGVHMYESHRWLRKAQFHNGDRKDLAGLVICTVYWVVIMMH